MSVVSLNETWLTPDRVINASDHGYQVFRKDRVNRSRGGVALLIDNSIPAVEIDLGNVVSDNEAVACELLLHDTRFTIASIYCPPDRRPDEHLLASLSRYTRALVLGDFNSKDSALGSRGQNANGPVMVKAIEDANLCLLSQGAPTHVHWDGSEDQLDLVLATPGLVGLLSDVTVLEDIGSDHYPVMVQLNIDKNLPAGEDEPWFNLKRADWSLYQDVLDLELTKCADSTSKKEDLDTLHQQIVSAIVCAAEISIPKCLPGRLKTWQMTPEILDVIRLRRHHKRRWIETRIEAFKSEYNRLTKQRNAMIAQAKAESWAAYCKKLERQFHTSSKDFWSQYASLATGTRKN